MGNVSFANAPTNNGDIGKISDSLELETHSRLAKYFVNQKQPYWF